MNFILECNNKADFEKDFDKEADSTIKIDKGSNGQVFKMLHKQEQRNYAVKEYETKSLDEFIYYQHEIYVLGLFQHIKNIIQIKKVYQFSSQGWNKILFSMELADESFAQIISKQIDLPAEKILIYLFDCLQTMDTLSKQNIYHRDIKPQNILLVKGIVKLADFSEVKFYNARLKKQPNSHTLKGSAFYMSPLLKAAYKNNQPDQKHDIEKSDVYSLGLTFLQLCLRLEDKAIATLNNSEDQKLLQEYLLQIKHPLIQEVLGKMLAFEEADRFSNRQLLNLICNSPIYQNLKNIHENDSNFLQGQLVQRNSDSVLQNIQNPLIANYLDNLRNQNEQLLLMQNTPDQIYRIAYLMGAPNQFSESVQALSRILNEQEESEIKKEFTQFFEKSREQSQDLQNALPNAKSTIAKIRNLIDQVWANYSSHHQMLANFSSYLQLFQEVDVDLFLTIFVKFLQSKVRADRQEEVNPPQQLDLGFTSMCSLFRSFDLSLSVDEVDVDTNAVRTQICPSKEIEEKKEQIALTLLKINNDYHIVLPFYDFKQSKHLKQIMQSNLKLKKEVEQAQAKAAKELEDAKTHIVRLDAKLSNLGNTEALANMQERTAAELLIDLVNKTDTVQLCIDQKLREKDDQKQAEMEQTLLRHQQETERLRNDKIQELLQLEQKYKSEIQILKETQEQKNQDSAKQSLLKAAEFAEQQQGFETQKKQLEAQASDLRASLKQKTELLNTAVQKNAEQEQNNKLLRDEIRNLQQLINNQVQIINEQKSDIIQNMTSLNQRKELERELRQKNDQLLQEKIKLVKEFAELEPLIYEQRQSLERKMLKQKKEIENQQGLNDQIASLLQKFLPEQKTAVQPQTNQQAPVQKMLTDL